MLPHNNRKYMVYNHQYWDQIGQYEHYKPYHPPPLLPLKLPGPIIYTLYIDGKVRKKTKTKRGNGVSG